MDNAAAPKVIGYIRVSTDKQDIGPEVQAAALGAEAARRGWRLEIRREDAASAKSLKGRPVLAQALADLKAGRADVLAVSKLDRLSRNVADLSLLLDAAERERWDLVLLDLNVDTTTTMGRAMAQVTATFAELERRRIGERTREGMAKIKADTGKHMGRRSTLPAEVADRIRADHAAGVPMLRIAQTLNDEGVATATGRGTWHASTVKQILSRTA